MGQSSSNIVRNQSLLSAGGGKVVRRYKKLGGDLLPLKKAKSWSGNHTRRVVRNPELGSARKRWEDKTVFQGEEVKGRSSTQNREYSWREKEELRDLKAKVVFVGWLEGRSATREKIETNSTQNKSRSRGG